ncbi:hypothetical protein [Paraburkholderia atlantica]|uniref:hypothetical protein n=1 Tax=Paraburkholderia atlantica TaxID=2654982 RepID=UPI003D1DD86B
MIAWLPDDARTKLFALANSRNASVERLAGNLLADAVRQQTIGLQMPKPVDTTADKPATKATTRSTLTPAQRKKLAVSFRAATRGITRGREEA